MTNMRWVRELIDQLAAAGVGHFVVCAGARNAPFVEWLSHLPQEFVTPYFDERAGAFFALGRSRRDQRPVAIVTTSGTAAAELLPAVVEAHYSGVPLVLVTADRPRTYRGSGAPQTIEQPGLYSNYVEHSWDLVLGDQPPWSEWTQERPLHLNVCLDEPLIDERPSSLNVSLSQPIATSGPTMELRQLALQAWRQFVSTVERPLVIVGGVPPAKRDLVKQFLLASQWPVYLEGPSGLREDADLADMQIRSGDAFVPRMFPECDGVIRIGQVPTLRFWRDLEDQSKPVISFADPTFRGLSRAAATVWPLSALKGLEFQSRWSAERWQKWRERDLHKWRSVETCLRDFPLSEPGFVRRLSQKIPAHAMTYIGNSLPIREWDQFAVYDQAHEELYASRGANGIDGQLSTFLGLCNSSRSNWGLFGDLTALYDLSAPWALFQQPLKDVKIVIMNNGGGRIFSRMFANPLFENKHPLHFSHWARMWDLAYECWNSEADLKSASSTPLVVEIQPDEEQTRLFWQRLATLEKES